MASSLMEDAPLASLPSFLSLERSLGLPIGPAADTELNKGLTISKVGLKNRSRSRSDRSYSPFC